jgi:hypothetical protein
VAVSLWLRLKHPQKREGMLNYFNSISRPDIGHS